MKNLIVGAVGPEVQLLQLALNRAEGAQLATDGIFGARTRAALLRFQANNGLAADGAALGATHRALMPYYMGFAEHKIRRGDTLFNVAQGYGTSVAAIVTANPGAAAKELRIGNSLVVPLPFEVVPTTISFTAELVGYCVRGIAARYPFVRTGSLGRSVMGKPLWYLGCFTARPTTRTSGSRPRCCCALPSVSPANTPAAARSWVAVRRKYCSALAFT